MPQATADDYGLPWPPETTQLEKEMWFIKNGGSVLSNDDKPYGKGLIYHYEQMRRCLWPELDDHRWHRLCRDEILKGKIIVLAGCASSGKTHSPAWIRLCEWMVFPEETCVLISSTDIRGLRQRIWAEITMLWQKAKDAFPDSIPGYLLDSKIAITTDKLEDGDFEERRVRDMRKGVFGVPCVQGGKFVGISKFVGIKQKRMRLIADELSMMQLSILSSISNLNHNEDFRACLCGNFNDPMDPLGKAAEPKDGYASHLEPTKSEVWDTKFMNGRCVNLIGTDSPNFDYPDTEPSRFKYLPSKEKMAEVLSGFPKDSLEYMSQCVGSMKQGVLERRVLTPDLCRKYGAMNDVTWAGTARTSICALDAAYGGDRCVCGHIEFGQDIDGKVIVSFHPPVIVPVLIGEQYGLPEEQIAMFVKDYCVKYGISADNFFHDSTGRGTLGTFMARIWSAQTNPVEFGGSPSTRPVSLDIYVYDDVSRVRRLKRCDEHYSKFVTELWWSLRYAIESSQVRNLPDEVVEEGSMRMWDKVRGDKYEIETKKDMKERVGRSPDFADWASIAIEGARRRGFQISKLANDSEDSDEKTWLRDLRNKQKDLRAKHSLTYA